MVASSPPVVVGFSVGLCLRNVLKIDIAYPPFLVLTRTLLNQSLKPRMYAGFLLK
jgi:hypothetical protein